MAILKLTKPIPGWDSEQLTELNIRELTVGEVFTVIEPLNVSGMSDTLKIITIIAETQNLPKEAVEALHIRDLTRITTAMGLGE